MEKQDMREDELIDLGSITEQTRGSEVNYADTNGGERILPGLTID